MTIDSVFILFKKTDFNTILACLGGKVYCDGGFIKFFVVEMGGLQFYRRRLQKFGNPLPKKMPVPLEGLHNVFFIEFVPFCPVTCL